MSFAIPFLIELRIAQAKIRCEVNNFCAKFGVFFDMFLRLSMRLGEELGAGTRDLRRIDALVRRWPAVAAAEVAVGLALVISVYRSRNTVIADEISMMKW